MGGGGGGVLKPTLQIHNTLPIIFEISIIFCAKKHFI